MFASANEMPLLAALLFDRSRRMSNCSYHTWCTGSIKKKFAQENCWNTAIFGASANYAVSTHCHTAIRCKETQTYGHFNWLLITRNGSMVCTLVNKSMKWRQCASDSWRNTDGRAGKSKSGMFRIHSGDTNTITMFHYEPFYLIHQFHNIYFQFFLEFLPRYVLNALCVLLK